MKPLMAGCPLMLLVFTNTLWAQGRPDFSGVWRLDAPASLLVDGPPTGDYQLTWIIDHREPDISIAVNIRDARGSTDYTFRCTTDGRQCGNGLPVPNETRTMIARWEENVLAVSQITATQTGSFAAHDRMTLDGSGEQLTFERTMVSVHDTVPARLLFRKLGPHPSQRPAPPPLPSVALPAELERVLRDYERYWHGGDSEALVALFTSDGMIARRGGWVRGTAALREGLQRTSSDLRLRAVSYSLHENTAWITGNYGYGSDPGIPDRGMFILALHRASDGTWLIAADLDGVIRP